MRRHLSLPQDAQLLTSISCGKRARKILVDGVNAETFQAFDYLPWPHRSRQATMILSCLPAAAGKIAVPASRSTVFCFCLLGLGSIITNIARRLDSRSPRVISAPHAKTTRKTVYLTPSMILATILVCRHYQNTSSFAQDRPDKTISFPLRQERLAGLAGANFRPCGTIGKAVVTNSIRRYCRFGNNTGYGLKKCGMTFIAPKTARMIPITYRRTFIGRRSIPP